MAPDELRELLSVLRGSGVRFYADDRVKVRLGPLLAPVDAVEDRALIRQARAERRRDEERIAFAHVEPIVDPDAEIEETS
jgi:hypothetical protein